MDIAHQEEIIVHIKIIFINFENDPSVCKRKYIGVEFKQGKKPFALLKTSLKQKNTNLRSRWVAGASSAPVRPRPLLLLLSLRLSSPSFPLLPFLVF